MTIRVMPINGANVVANVPTPPAPTQRSYGLSGYASTSASTTTSSAVLTFGVGNIPSFVAIGMRVLDVTSPGAITGGQTVSSINSGAGTVTLTADVNGAVGSGDALVFYPAFVDVPGDASGDAAAIASQGFVGIGTSGPTSARPTNVGPGSWHVDTTLGEAVVFDGKSWRNPVTGVAV
jgi:hypothetical protein